jgi:hypothetical protein
MTHLLPEGLHKVGHADEDVFLRIDQLLKEAAPNTERLSFVKLAGHQQKGFSASQQESIEAIFTPFVADLDTPYTELSLGIDLRGQAYYGRQEAQRQSFWHSEASSRSLSNIGHLGTWFLVDQRSCNPNAGLRALTGTMLAQEYGMDPVELSELPSDALAEAGLAIYQATPGSIIDYSGVLHRVPADLYDNPDCGQRIFARVTVF